MRRNGALAAVPVADLVVGVAVRVAEGNRLPADGTASELNDFTVDEAILTDEAVPVARAVGEAVFGGTSTAPGSAWLTLTAVSGQTRLGLIGHSLESITPEKTPRQLQVRQFVLRRAWVGAAAVLGVYYVAIPRGLPLPVGRTLVFTTLVFSNILLMFVNRSFTQSVWRTLRVPDRVFWLMLGLTLALLLVTLLVPAAQRLFGSAPVPLTLLGGCRLAALVGAGWVEVYKAVRR